MGDVSHEPYLKQLHNDVSATHPCPKCNGYGCGRCGDPYCRGRGCEVCARACPPRGYPGARVRLSAFDPDVLLALVENAFGGPDEKLRSMTLAALQRIYGPLR